MRCQVVENRDQWPYKSVCYQEADYRIKDSVRRDNPQITEEYICGGHAQVLCEEMGKQTVEELK